MLMVRLFSKYALCPVATLLILVLAATLVWCGDPACQAGTGDDHCVSLLCSLFSSHSAPEKNGNCDRSTECKCFCHMPTLSGTTVEIDHHLTAENVICKCCSSTPCSPSRSIYHPPKA